MTREEREQAISEFNSFKENGYNHGYLPSSWSIEMAIQALEQEPCEDWYDVPSNEMNLEQARRAVRDLRKKLAEHLEQEPCEDAVSREALISHIENQSREWGEDYDAQQILGDIEDMPSVKPQPCEDAISRSDAIRAIDEKAKRIKNEDTLNGLAGAVGILFDLPSVNPQPKTGQWIEHRKTGHIESICSECGAEEGYPYNDYCGNCGAKMFEEQESEEV